MMLRRVLDRESVVKSNLTERLIDCVKECQLKAAGNENASLVTDETTNSLCWTIEAIFMHGLKTRFLKSMSSVLSSASSRETSGPEPCFWEFLLIFSHNDVIRSIESLNYVITDVGRCRAWLRLSLNEGLLISYLRHMMADKGSLKEYYKPNAHLRDPEHSDIMTSYLSGLESYEFRLACNSSLLNSWNSEPLRLVGLWTQGLDSVSQGIDVAENMDSRDLQALPELQVQGNKTPPNPIGSFYESGGHAGFRVPLLEEDEALRVILSSRGSSRQDSGCGSSLAPPPIPTLAPIQGGPHGTQPKRSSSSSKGKAPGKGQGSSSGGSVIIDNSTGEISNRGSEGLQKTGALGSTPPIHISSTTKTAPENFQKGSHYQTTTTQPMTSSISSNTELVETSEIETSGRNPRSPEEESSYAALFQSYNRDNVLGTPITIDSFLDGNGFSGRGGESETATSVTDSSTPSEDNRNVNFPPMEFYMGHIPSETGMDAQSYQCRSCDRPIGMFYGEARVCGYSGSYFCTDCHLNEESVIPSRIILNWDFNRYPVSRQANEFLQEILEKPLFDLKLRNEKLYGQIEECSELQRLRTRLQSITIYLRSCQLYKSMTEGSKEVWPKEHLLQHVHFYSLSDLLNIPNRSLSIHLSKLDSLGSAHITSCSVCLQKGFVCEVCRDPKVIFPFNLAKIYKCSDCGAVYHKKCMDHMKPCPRCLRWKFSAYDESIE